MGQVQWFKYATQPTLLLAGSAPTCLTNFDMSIQKLISLILPEIGKCDNT